MFVSVMDLSGQIALAANGILLGPNGTRSVTLEQANNCGLPVLLRIALGPPMQIVNVHARPFGEVGNVHKITITDAALLSGEKSSYEYRERSQ